MMPPSLSAAGRQASALADQLALSAPVFPQIVEGHWDLGSYRLVLDPSGLSLATASVTFIKRRGTFDACVKWHDVSGDNPTSIYNLLTSSFPTLEVFVEHTYLVFTLHIYPIGLRPRTLAERYANILSMFSRELLLGHTLRFAILCESVEALGQTDCLNFAWSLLESSKREKDPVWKTIGSNAAFLINYFDTFAEADLSNGQLPFAKIPRAILHGADLSQACLTSVDLAQSTFSDADFRGSKIDRLSLGRFPVLKVVPEKQLTDTVFSHDARLIASCLNDNCGPMCEIALWRIDTYEPLAPIIIGNEAVTLAFSKGGYLAIGDKQGNIHIWKEVDKTCSFTPLKKLNAYVGEKICCLQFSPLNPFYLAVGTEKGSVSVWNISTENTIFRNENSEATRCIKGLTFSPQAFTLVSLDDKGTLTLWDLSERKKNNQWQFEGSQSTQLLGFSIRGELLAICEGASISFWEISSGKKVLKKIPRSTGPVCLTSDFKYILFSEQLNDRIYIQNIQTDELPEELDVEASEKHIQALMLLPNERTVIAKSWNTIFLCEVRSNRDGNFTLEPIPHAFHLASQKQLRIASQFPDMIFSMCNNLKNYQRTPIKRASSPIQFSADGSLLLGVRFNEDGREETVITRTDTGKMVWQFFGPNTDNIRLSDFHAFFKQRSLSPNNCLLAALSLDEEHLEVWDIIMQNRLCSRVLKNVENNKGNRACFAFKSDNQTLAIAPYSPKENQTQILLWHLETDSTKLLFETNGKVLSCSFSPDDRLFFFTKMSENEIYVCCWDFIQQKVIFLFNGLVAAYCPKTKLVAKGRETLSLSQFDGSEEIDLFPNSDQSPGIAVDLQFSADGKRLAAKIVPFNDVKIGYTIQSVFVDEFFVTLYLWEVETSPHLHARLIDRFPHELIGRRAKFDQQIDLPINKQVLLEKGAQFM